MAPEIVIFWQFMAPETAIMIVSLFWHDIKILDEMKETDKISPVLIAMMADEEQLDVLAGKGSNRLNSVQKF